MINTEISDQEKWVVAHNGTNTYNIQLVRVGETLSTGLDFIEEFDSETDALAKYGSHFKNAIIGDLYVDTSYAEIDKPTPPIVGKAVEHGFPNVT